MAFLDFLADILPAPARQRRRPAHECGVNVTVCEWDEATWVENAHVIASIQQAVSGSFSLCMTTEEMEDDLLAEYADFFAEICVEKVDDTEFQVTLITHESAATDAD